VFAKNIPEKSGKRVFGFWMSTRAIWAIFPRKIIPNSDPKKPNEKRSVRSVFGYIKAQANFD